MQSICNNCKNCPNPEASYSKRKCSLGHETHTEEIEMDGLCNDFNQVREIICGNCSNFTKNIGISQTCCIYWTEDDLLGYDDTEAFPVKLKSSFKFCEGYSANAVYEG